MKKRNKAEKFFFGHDNPGNNYEKCPVLAWLIMGAVITYGILGAIVMIHSVS